MSGQGESRAPWNYAPSDEFVKCHVCKVLRREHELNRANETVAVCKDEHLCDKWVHQRTETGAW